MSISDHSYVRLAQPALKWDAEDAEVFFDELNDQVVLVKERRMHVFPFDTNATPRPISYVNKDGELSAVRLSPDGRYLGIRRSVHQVEVVDLHSMEPFYLSPKKRQYALILDFFWCRAEFADIVLATSSGLELFKLVKGEEVKAKRLKSPTASKVVWVRYLAPQQIIVMGGGSQANMVHIYQIINSQVVKFPKFEVDLPARSAILRKEHILVGTLYGVLYCLHAEVHSRKLVLFRIYPDVSVRTAIEFQLFSDSLALSIVDNVILVHYLDTKISMAYDINVKKRPFMDPLPISAAPPAPSPLPSSHNDPLAPGTPQQAEGKPSGTAQPTPNPVPQVLELYKREWKFMPPDTVIDMKEGFAWKLRLDLDEIATSCIEPLALLAFLMHRSSAKTLVLGVLRAMVTQPSHSLSVMESAFNLLNTAYVTALKRRKELEKGGRNSGDSYNTTVLAPRARSVVDQGEVFSFVFTFLHTRLSEESPDSPTGLSPSRLLDCVRTYVLSLNLHYIQVSPALYELLIALYVHCDQLHQIELGIRYKFIEDSLPVAHALLNLATDSRPALQLALDMLTRLGLDDEVLKALLRHKQILSACQYVRQRRIVRCAPRPFLEAALATGDRDLYFTVFNFFAQRNWVVRGDIGFTPEENCAEFVAKYDEMFGRVESNELF